MSAVSISIITPTLNQAGFIERTVESVLSQDAGVPVEYLVADGGSSDGTLQILARYPERLTVLPGPDRGMGDALNKGFAASSGEIIGWLNSDDMYLPGTLRKVVEWFRDHPEVLWLYGNCRMVDEQDREVRKWITAYKNRKAGNYSYECLLTENFISQPTVFFRRIMLESAGPVDESLPTAMDYDLWLRFARLGEPGYMDEDLACFRVHGQSISAKNYRKQFSEQYGIHARYDRNPLRLFRHRVKNAVIVTVYTLMGHFRGVR